MAKGFDWRIDAKKLGIPHIDFGNHKKPKESHAPKLAYYASQEASAVISEVHSTPGGISQAEAERRLKEHGKNVLNDGKDSAILAFAAHLLSPLALILIAAAVISFYTGDHLDAAIIIIIIFVSTVLNFFQEYRASTAARKLKEKVTTTATVLREGQEIDIKIANICVGDVVVLRAGDLVPADCRIIESKDLFVNQSSLTGESLPCDKHAPSINNKAASLSELTNIVFLGSSVVSGKATAVVVQTGGETQFGKIAQDLSSAPTQTDFEVGIKKFTYLALRSIIFLVLFIFLIKAVIEHDYLEALIFAIAVAIGLTPDLLPMILTVNMSKGSLNMAKKGVIVKRLNSIPNLGSMDVLCTDKTGTLTLDHIQLVQYLNLDGKEDERILVYTYLNSMHQTGIRNPLDKAVLEFKKPSAIRTLDYAKIDEMPFDFVRKRVSIVVAKRGKKLLISKGAPEEILKICTHYRIKGKDVRLTDNSQKELIWKQYTALSKQGYRVLAVSIRYLRDGAKKVYTQEDERDMIFVGFVAFLDPPKHDVKPTLTELNRMGVEVKVVTGDNELVTQKICKEIGLSVKGVLLGSEVDAYNDTDLRKKVETTTIFARFSPSQKNRIILSLKANGHVVGFLGDGINDAPSLKTADVGISVDSAVDVAKESADMILTHKSLKELRDGVIEGRKTFGNTMKYVMMSISSNFGNMFSVAGAVVLLPFLPMLPVMILFNNLLYDVSQLPIPTDPVDEEYIERPRKWDIDFIRKFMYTFGVVSSLFDFITFGILYLVFRTPAAWFQTGWFLESLATQTLVVHVIRTKKTPIIQSRASKLLTFSTVGVVLFGWAVPFTPLGKYLGFKALPVPILLTLMGVVLVYLCVVQVLKTQFYTKYQYG